MKLLKKIILIAVIIFAVIFIGASVFVALNGKRIVVTQLEEITKRKVSIGSLGMSLPFNVSIHALDIEGLLKAEHISVTPGILSLFSGTVVLDDIEIIKPYLIYEKPQPKAQTLPTVFLPAPVENKAEPAEVITTPATPAQKNKPARIAIGHLGIRDGKLEFIDTPSGSEKVKIMVTDIDFSLNNLYLFPSSAVSRFKLEAKVPWATKKEEGVVRADGWMDISGRNMEADVKINGIDGVYLYPYYATWVDLERSRIESATLNFESKIKSKDNDLAADCRIELADIVFKPRTGGEEMEKAEKIAKAVLDIFKMLNQNRVVFNFTIRTKMNKLRFSFNDMKGAFETRLAEGLKSRRISAEQVALFPAKVVGGTIKETGKTSLALLDGAVSLGKELAKSVAFAFDRKNNKK